MGRATQVADLLDTLAGEDPEVVRRALNEFAAKDQTAALAAREGGNGGSQAVARIPVSSAELLTFATSAPRKVIVAGQGAGTIVMPRAYTVQYLAGSSPYAPDGGSATFGLGWGDDGAGDYVVCAHATFEATFDGDGTRILEQLTDRIKVSGDGVFDFDINGKLGAPISDLDDADLTFGFAVSEGSSPVTDGDGTLVVIVTYDIITL